MSIRHAVAAALLCGGIVSSHATVVAIAADAQWNTFNVNDIDAQSFGVEWIDNSDTMSPNFGTALEFTFSVASGFKGLLSVVDAGFAGDTFSVTNFGQLIGNTSGVPVQAADTSPYVGADFDAAWADSSFSRAVFELAAGTYRITGRLDQSVTFDQAPLNSTVGALKLAVVAVPEPSTWAALAAGLGLLAFMARRQRR